MPSTTSTRSARGTSAVARRPRGRVPAGLLLAAVVLAGCGGNRSGADAGPPDDVLTAPAPAVDLPQPDGPRTILLAGLDRRFADGPGARTRSDTMLLVRLDPGAKATAMLSLPRDLRVEALGPPDRDKLNQAWFRGGPKRLERAVETEVLGTEDDPFEVDDVLSVRFGTFAKIVNALGCLYVDVDRRYLVPPGAGHAEIDQAAGYDRLCGEDALAFVRYRIGDSDFVREARQAQFLTEARTQIDPLAVLSGGLLPRLARLVGKDADTRADLEELVRLAVYVVGRPTARITIDGLRDATDGSGDVLASEGALRRARGRFLDPRLPAQKTPVEERTGRPAVLPERGRRLRTTSPDSLTRDAAGARAAAADVRRGTGRLPVLVPDLRPRRAAYDARSSRGYRIVGPRRRGGWSAYRVVLRTATGQAYGVQGTAWKDPPALGLAGDVVRIGGRTWTVQANGRRVHRLLWRDPDGRGTYWITNTLDDELDGAEMYAIAKSLRER